jgi:REP element-mobilizing transposase RayT
MENGELKMENGEWKMENLYNQRKSIRLKGYDYSLAGLYFVTICTQNRAYLFGNIQNAQMILNDSGNMISKWYYELENKFPNIHCHQIIIMPNHIHFIVQITYENNDIQSGEQNDIQTGEHIGSPLHQNQSENPPTAVGANLRVRPSMRVCPDNAGEHIGSPLQNHIFRVCPENDINNPPVGADLRVCPDNDNMGENSNNNSGEHTDIQSNEHNNPPATVRADLRVCPQLITGEHIGSPLQNHIFRVCPENDINNPPVGADLRVCPSMRVCPQLITGEHIGSPLHVVIQWFKTMTTNHYIRGVKQQNWQPFNGKLWQRNYWEHIIRNENSYQNISEYIKNNPQNWENDTLFTIEN